jgi:exopolysaccharide production protein ExoZ
MTRLFTLDYLRGLAALSIMLYHYFTFTYGEYDVDSIVSRVGVYGVSIFYVLSGLTLFHVYYDMMSATRCEIFSFFKKRFYRIFPLLWLVTIAAIVLSSTWPNWYDLFLNLTGLFGFIKWDTYFSTGIWSIGNELVFYSIFPLFVLLAKSYRFYFLLLILVILLIYVYFAFVKLKVDPSWRNYVNPLNQVFLFLGGFLIGWMFRKVNIRLFALLILLVCVSIVFVVYPVNGGAFELKTGITRMVFTSCCLLVCLCFYKLKRQLPSSLHKPLVLLGEISYSLYLFHMLVYSCLHVFRQHVYYFSDTVHLVFSVGLTLVMSYLSYQYFEKYFMRLGKSSGTFERFERA